MVSSGCCDLQRLLRVVLAHHFVHVADRQQIALRQVASSGVHMNLMDRVVGTTSEQFDEFTQMRDVHDIQAVNQFSLIAVGTGNHDAVHAMLLHMQHDWQQAVDGQHRAIEVELAE